VGIVFSLIRVRPETVDALRDSPKGVAEFVYGDSSLYEAPSPGLLQRLFGKPEPEPRPIPVRREDDEIDLDKSWHIVHYLLTGSDNATDSPLNIIADESDRLADIDLGLGPPFVIHPEVVSRFAAAAAELSDEQFLSRLHPSEMPLETLYLGDSVRDDPDEMGEYAVENFHFLRTFARAAADAGDAVITYYS
jgi:hypothetical protein